MAVETKSPNPKATKSTDSGSKLKKSVKTTNRNKKIKKSAVSKSEKSTSIDTKPSNVDIKPKTSPIKKPKITKRKSNSPFDPNVLNTVKIEELPHGFYENQLKRYFSQFGKVDCVLVSRSRMTGKAKSTAFVRFVDPNVAKIATETMDKYLMFDCLLRCTLVAKKFVKSQANEQMVRRYKERARRNYNRKLTMEEHEELQKDLIEGVKSNLLQLNELGVSYEFDIPKIGQEKKYPLISTRDEGIEKYSRHVWDGGKPGNPTYLAEEEYESLVEMDSHAKVYSTSSVQFKNRVVQVKQEGKEGGKERKEEGKERKEEGKEGSEVLEGVKPVDVELMTKLEEFRAKDDEGQDLHDISTNSSVYTLLVDSSDEEVTFKTPPKSVKKRRNKS